VLLALSEEFKLENWSESCAEVRFVGPRKHIGLSVVESQLLGTVSVLYSENQLEKSHTASLPEVNYFNVKRADTRYSHSQ
jgi:hypothetical protein